MEPTKVGAPQADRPDIHRRDLDWVSDQIDGGDATLGKGEVKHRRAACRPAPRWPRSRRRRLQGVQLAVSAWREASYFSGAERAALALSEAMARLSDHAEAAPDEVWNNARKRFHERGLSALHVAVTNLFNRLDITTRQLAGAWAP